MQTIHLPNPSQALVDALHFVHRQHSPILLTTNGIEPAVLIDYVEFERYQQWQNTQRKISWQTMFDALNEFEPDFKLERAEQIEQIREELK